MNIYGYGLCQIIGQNNRFGPAQIASLTAEVKTIVECREICPHIFPSILEALKSSTSANVRMLGNRLEPLLQHDMFERRQNGSSSLPISPHIHIFDVSSYLRFPFLHDCIVPKNEPEKCTIMTSMGKASIENPP